MGAPDRPAQSSAATDPAAGASMQPTQRRLANAIRALAMDAVEAANSGHPGMPMGMADAATALFTPASEVRSRRSRTGPTATASCCRPATARC